MRKLAASILALMMFCEPVYAQNAGSTTSTTILQLPVAGPLTGAEIIPLDQIQGLAASPQTMQTTLNAMSIFMYAHLPPASAGTPGGVFSSSAPAHQYATGISTAGVVGYAQPSASDVTGLAPSATTDTTNAANITSGLLASARLPLPTATNLGGIVSLSPVVHQFLTGIGVNGAPIVAQPAAGDVSGLAASATTDTTNTLNIIGSLPTTKVANLSALLAGLGTYDSNGNFYGRIAVTHVANAAAVATQSPAGQTIFRDDVAVYYQNTGAACSAADGVVQITNTASNTCWKTDISNGAPLELWGGSKNDTTPNQIAYNNALNAISAVGGGKVTLGATAPGQCYLFTSGVIDTLPNVQLVGQPGGSCVDRGFASGTLFLQGSTSATGILNKGVTNVTFKHSVTTTGGPDLQFVGTRNAVATNTTCLKGAYQCIAVDNSVLTDIKNFQESAEGQTGIAIGCNYPGVTANVAIRVGNINYQHRSAIEGCNFSGVSVEAGFNTDFNNHGFWAHPNTGQYANGLSTKTGTYFDASFNEGVLFDLSGGGSAGENLMDPNTWVVSCGATVTIPPSNIVTGDPFVTPFTEGSSVPCFRLNASLTATSGANSAVHNIFKAFVFNAAGEGVVANGGHWNDYGGTSTANCAAYAPTDGLCSGFKAKAGTSDFTWDGRLGGRSSLGGSNSDAYGAVIEAGASNGYRLTGDGRGNVTGVAFDGGTGIDRDLSGLIGFTGYSYTPALGSQSGTFTTASVQGSYNKTGSAVTAHMTMAVTTNGSAAGYATISLPMPALTGFSQPCSVRDNTTGAIYGGIIQSGGSSVIIQNGTSYPTSATSWGADVTCAYTAAQ